MFFFNHIPPIQTASKTLEARICTELIFDEPDEPSFTEVLSTPSPTEYLAPAPAPGDKIEIRIELLPVVKIKKPKG
jgi:hypothetical protein